MLCVFIYISIFCSSLNFGGVGYYINEKIGLWVILLKIGLCLRYRKGKWIFK